MAHPHKPYDPNGPIRRLREICLALPGAIEKEAWGECTFRVGRGKMFAMTDNDHHQSGHYAVWCLASPMVQEILVKDDPKHFFVPPYLGHKGWVGVRLDVGGVNWEQLAGILQDGYKLASAKHPATVANLMTSSIAPNSRKKKPRARRAPQPTHERQ
jgi:predicted DNA-binding protein (MmcQ/YjbR family)